MVISFTACLITFFIVALVCTALGFAVGFLSNKVSMKHWGNLLDAVRNHLIMRGALEEIANGEDDVASDIAASALHAIDKP